MDILKIITKYRDDRGWSNNRLSVEAGVGSATVQNWYKRGAIPQYDAIVALCDAFGVTLAEFFNDTPERISLTTTQSEFLAEMDLMNKTEKAALLNLVKEMNAIKKLPQ